MRLLTGESRASQFLQLGIQFLHCFLLFLLPRMYATLYDVHIGEYYV